jgi:osmoprotectant transport system permease protein
MSLPVTLAGLRVATVSNISIVSVGALIGVGGLGGLFTRGLQLHYLEPVIVGIVLSIALAAVCDLAIVALQRQLTPWTRLGGKTR